MDLSSAFSEDCLFLNVYAPRNATNLPVLVYIHGGGYGEGNGRLDMASIINTNNNGFIVVGIQYRLGAFGFLSSDEVTRFGVANAGIRDQTFALQWVQSYIHLFGGDASAVTIAGESAGGGSVMLQAMASGGQLGKSLFNNIIAASPYLPMQYKYNDFVPSQSYYAFAQAAGCFQGLAEGSPATAPIFQCLVGKDSSTLMNASALISTSGMYGTWGFLPVTDGNFILEAPSQQLLKKNVNGVRVLSGNNANEGPLFTPQNITTEADLVSWIQATFPLMTIDDISKLLRYYPSSNASDSSSNVDFATLGYTGPTAVNQSSLGTGQQQRANDIYAETTFVCPSYWLAEAFTSNGREAWKYQYSVLPALHGIDTTAYFGPPAASQGAAFSQQFMKIWGNFIVNNNPSVASGSGDVGVSAIANWPTYNTRDSPMINCKLFPSLLVKPWDVLLSLDLLEKSKDTNQI
jgi:carboxylesterase type B